MLVKIEKSEFEKKLLRHAVVVYGTKRYVRDFIYVYTQMFGKYFDRYYFCENVPNIMDVPILNNELMVLCGKVTEQEILEKCEYSIVMMEDLFEYLDEINVGYFDKKNPSSSHCRLPDKKIALWGSNDACRFFISHQLNVKIACIIDYGFSKYDSITNEIPIVSPKEIEAWNEYFVLIMENDAKYEIRDFLLERNLKEVTDFTYYGYYGPWGLTASQMMRKTILAPSLNVTCKEAFEFAFTEKNGELWMCCYAPGVSLGNILHESFDNVWKGTYAALLRLSMINQTYSFCNKYTCIYNLAEDNVLASDLEESNYLCAAEAVPKRLSISHSNTCNMWCESCRKEIFVEKELCAERAMNISEIVVKDILPKVETIIIAGNGEIFASEAYQYILNSSIDKKMTEKDWNIFTNGKLLTQKNLDKVLTLGGGRINLIVSVDAATKETYEKLRRGGNWESLIQNLENAGRLCKNGQIQNMTLDFVVQKKNIAEMAAFIKLAKRVGADNIVFTGIANWGTYSSEEFDEISILDMDGKCKQQYKHYFENPILYSKGVSLGNIHIENATAGPADWNQAGQILGLDQPMWRKRIIALRKFIDADDKSVMDIGAGNMYLKKILPVQTRYYPLDYTKRCDETLVCDLNQYEFPTIHADAAVCAGILEYLNDVDWFFDQITSCVQKIAVSYKSKECGFKQSVYTTDDIINMLYERGFILTKWDKELHEEWPLLACFQKAAPGLLRHNYFCTGCGACANVCPADALYLAPDEMGFLKPVIDAGKCTNCRKCVEVCPGAKPVQKQETASSGCMCYAAWAEDEIRRDSSSGGAFSVFAKKVLENKGIVYGAAYTKDFYIEHIGVGSISGLGKLRHSKYAQSNVKKTFQEVKAQVLKEVMVLYVGTPCQIAGLKSFLGQDYDNLIMVDFVCFCAAPVTAFRKYLAECHGMEDIENIVFRDKYHGWNGHGHSIQKKDGTMLYLNIRIVTRKHSMGRCAEARLVTAAATLHFRVKGILQLVIFGELNSTMRHGMIRKAQA